MSHAITFITSTLALLASNLTTTVEEWSLFSSLRTCGHIAGEYLIGMQNVRKILKHFHNILSTECTKITILCM
jgi:hypothetical protein